MKTTIKLLGLLLLSASISCSNKKATDIDVIVENTTIAEGQYELQTNIIEKATKVLIPRTIDKEGKIVYVPIDDWTSGFFAGSIWFTYKLSNNKKWLPLAEKYTERLDSVKYLKAHHDVGFMIGSSYLNGYRQTGNEKYKEVIVETAKSLSTRFRPNAGILQSWNVDKDWQSKRGWKCPVIIDNMMNLELMFEATRLSGDSSFYKIAVSHANKTLANHYRDNNSSYHVVDYDPETGAVRSKETAQGFANESSWARGQAWGLYGYIVCYRYTKNPIYLEQAKKIYDYIFTEKTLPKDLIPYWDYNAPNIPSEPRDVSAAAVTASALYEMSTYLPDKKYKITADKIIATLSTSAYRAEIGTNANFILKHSVGSLPHNNEIDVPLSYADYYFLEALIRKRDNLNMNYLTQAIKK
ncbi:MAG: glycoside hydrolase family 88 protein [Paludibacter sp.]